MSLAIPATPELIPVFRMKFQLESAPKPLFTDVSRKTVSSMAIVPTGRISTIKNKLGLELDVEDVSGFDNITTHYEEGYSLLDAHGHGKTKEGIDVNFSSWGVFHSSPGLDAVLSWKATSHSFEESYASMSPRFTLEKNCPETLKWLERENIIGKGRFSIEDGLIFVESFGYVLR